MKLKYKILWIDDNIEIMQVKESIDSIVECVNSYGFDMDKKDVDTYENADELQVEDYKEYDMILIDFELGEGQEGQKIIKKIRDEGIYNEILFYSSTPESLGEKIAKERIEGVFCSGRADLPETFKKIFEVSIKKVLDLNNLRGLVMAEVSDLEELKTEILREAYKKKIIEESFFEEKVFHSIIKKFWDNLKKVKKYSNFEITEKYKKKAKEFPKHNIDNFLSDKDKLFNMEFKIKALQGLINDAKLTSEFKGSDYKKEIQEKRNKLAHVVEEWVEIEGKNVQKLKGTNFEFNEKTSKEIFEDIKKYKRILKSLKQEIQSLKNV